MNPRPTRIDGVFQIELEPIADSRGFFMRVYEDDVFTDLGLDTSFPHHNLAYNAHRGILRGLHYQVGESAESKVVHCLRGAIYDVLVDLRPSSSSFRTVQAFHLTSSEPTLLYVPEGVAHGYQTLEDHATIHYLMGAVYEPDAQRGIAWDEPQLGIEWPISDPLLSDKDRSHPPLDWEAAWPSD